MKSFDRRCTFSFLSDAHFQNLSGGAHFQSFVMRCTFSIFCQEVHIFYFYQEVHILNFWSINMQSLITKTHCSKQITQTRYPRLHAMSKMTKFHAWLFFLIGKICSKQEMHIFNVCSTTVPSLYNVVIHLLKVTQPRYLLSVLDRCNVVIHLLKVTQPRYLLSVLDRCMEKEVPSDQSWWCRHKCIFPSTNDFSVNLT